MEDDIDRMRQPDLYAPLNAPADVHPYYITEPVPEIPGLSLVRGLAEPDDAEDETPEDDPTDAET